MIYLAIKHFAQFQHYKDRNPLWIKLYNTLLDDYAFLSLSEVTQRHLVMLWLVASRLDNRIPYDHKYIAQAVKARGRVDIQAMIDAGFLVILSDPTPVEQPASKMLAEPEQAASTSLAEPEHNASETLAELEQSASPRARPRARGETERETEKRNTSPPPAHEPEMLDQVIGRLPEGYGGDLKALAERVPNVTPWCAELLAWLDGLRTPQLTPEQLGQAIRDFNGNGADVSLKLFRGYLRDAALPAHSASGKSSSNGDRPKSRTHPGNLRSEGMLIFGQIRDAISTVYVQNDPGDVGAGGYHAKRIKPDVLAALPPAAHRALKAIGGERAIAAADGAQLTILAGQFATAYR